MTTTQSQANLVPVSPEQRETAATDATRTHIRGSLILLLGRVIALGLNFLVQILTVRYLAKSDYGAFAYALSVVSLGASVSLFGLDKAVARFVPIYQEHKEFGKMFGTIVMSFATILGIGIALVLFAFGAQGLLSGRVINDPLALSLLLVMIALAPMQALDSWFQGIFAVFARPQAIFFRRHLLGPSLKLLAVLAVVLTRNDVYFLAIGYVVGGLFGVASYVLLLVHVFREQGLWERFNFRRIILPFREVFSFSTPLLTSDAVNILKTNVVVILLEFFATTVHVAEFQAVLPVARLNLFVMQSFKYLFTPLAARLFAKNDARGINELYWQTATWIALFTFPVFAASFSLARPVTVTLFGTRYASSAAILAILALGNYFNAAFGFNAYTLRVYGRVRYIVAIDILSGVLTVMLTLWLIPRYGAIGAAVGTTVALVVYNLLNHVGLLLGTNIDLFQWKYLRVYASIALAAIALLILQQLTDLPIPVGIVVVGVVSLALLRLNRSVMKIGQMFPELLRIPVVNQFVT